AGVDHGHGLRDLVEKMAIAASRLAELPLPGQRAGAEVPPPERPAVACLVCRKRGLRNRDGAEPGPEPERVGRDWDAAQCDDSFRGLGYREVPRDDFANSVPEDMAGSRRDLNRRDDEEVGVCRGLCDLDSAHGVVIRDGDPRKTSLSGDSHERRRVDAGRGRLERVKYDGWRDGLTIQFRSGTLEIRFRWRKTMCP